MSSNNIHYSADLGVDIMIIKKESEPDTISTIDDKYETQTNVDQIKQKDIKIEVKIEECDEEISKDITYDVPLVRGYGKSNVLSTVHVQDQSNDVSIGSDSVQDTITKKNQCHLCLDTISNNQKYKKHMVVHSRVKKIRCITCEIIYLDQKDFISHMLSCHAYETAHQCKICSRTFPQKSILEKHMVIHSSETYSCDLCNEYFQYKSLLTIHMRKHIGGKVHVCDKCHKEFESPTALKNHKVIHTGEKRFICKICKVGFSRQPKLNRHMLQHRRVKV